MWFLSFDCATKSFAFCLVEVRPAARVEERLELCLEAARSGNLEGVARGVEALEADMRGLFRLEAGGAADLAPGIRDKKVPTVARVRRLLDFLETRVEPALLEAQARGCPAVGPELHVAVEWQMGANTPSRVIAHALVTRYAAAHVFMVAPTLKNRLRFAERPDLDHCMFVERYARTYTANKEHAKSAYRYLSGVFAHARQPVPAKMEADFADSALQVLGVLLAGDVEGAPLRY